jgi:hypothetical protein
MKTRFLRKELSVKKASLIALALLAVVTLAAWAIDVSGIWILATPGRDDQMMERDITIVQEGNKIKVTMPMPGPPGGEPREPVVGEGTIEGNAIQWKVVMETPRGEFTMEYKGTVEGDTMKGTTMRRDQEVEWTAKKK